MSSIQLHEDGLSPETVDRHRAITSIMEELEAVDWYHQRAQATGDAELRALLEHNRDEEKEHASMLIEWLRRQDEQLDRHLRTYLFHPGSIVEIEHEAEHGDGAPSGGDLGIGSLREVAAS